MDTILPRKYNNKVVIGLGIALLAAVGVAIYFYMRESPSKAASIAHQHPPPHNHQHAQHAHQHAQHPTAPEHMETRVGGDKPALVLIWAGWCGHSKQFIPTWEKIVAILNKDGAIDAVDLSDEKNKDEIERARPNIPEFRGYPHIRFYPDGYAHNKKSIAYDGPRTEEGILKFAYQSFGA